MNESGISHFPLPTYKSGGRGLLYGSISSWLALIPQPLLPVGEGEQDFQVPLPVGEGFRVRAVRSLAKVTYSLLCNKKQSLRECKLQEAIALYSCSSTSRRIFCLFRWLSDTHPNFRGKRCHAKTTKSLEDAGTQPQIRAGKP